MNELSREQALTVPVGRDLDTLVARHVFGLRVEEVPVTRRDGTSDVALLVEGRYWPSKCSTEIAQAMDVLCKARASHGDYFVIDFLTGKYRCRFEGSGAAHGDTISEAICRAALLASVDSRDSLRSRSRSR